ncbi:MAG: tRNA (adenine-N1)-methyltransferase [Candidatus Freyarchaeota archaeon]|nr:tRNA (adenine-N1)-methyltransferase [Candidatus Jordarchaeia archaeon]
MGEEPIAFGDYVLIVLDERRKWLVRVKEGETLHTHKGSVDLGSLIGLPYGCVVKSNKGEEFFIVRPTLADFAVKAKRATQIIYPKDLGFILMNLAVGRGSRVVEAGTGSGVLTGVLASWVMPEGRVYSYEIREEFLKVAKKNLERMGVAEYVELKNKDIAEGIDEGDVDAVVLDVATPWLIVGHAYRALKAGRVMASFSPTIEQVQRTVLEMEKAGFVDVRTYECLLREVIVKEGRTRPESFMVGHTGYMTFGRKVIRSS